MASKKLAVEVTKEQVRYSALRMVEEGDLDSAGVFTNDDCRVQRFKRFGKTLWAQVWIAVESQDMLSEDEIEERYGSNE